MLELQNQTTQKSISVSIKAGGIYMVGIRALGRWGDEVDINAAAGSTNVNQARYIKVAGFDNLVFPIPCNESNVAARGFSFAGIMLPTRDSESITITSEVWSGGSTSNSAIAYIGVRVVKLA